MKKIVIFALLAIPAAAYCQGSRDSGLDGAGLSAANAVDSLDPVQRPDSQRIMSELSTVLRLSSKQEERITSAVKKKTAEFDKLMKEYDKNSAEEKKWRYKMNSNRHDMLKLNRELPDAIRDLLDDEQRQSYDEMLQAARKPPEAELAKPAADENTPKPVKKKRLIRRRKVSLAAPDEEDPGQVMVDKDAARPGVKKKRILRKKPAPAAAEEAAGALPTGQEAAPAEEDAGSYP